MGAKLGQVNGSSYEFGHWDYKGEIQDKAFHIFPSKNFSAAVDSVKNENNSIDGWFYPPLDKSLTGELYIPVRRFELPVTHTLEVYGAPYEKEFGEFLILVLGFMQGLRLTLAGTGHLMRTPVKKSTLVDFFTTCQDTLVGLRAAMMFWQSRDKEERKLAFSAIHWYLTSQSYIQQYDIFVWQYAALDSIYRLTKGISRNNKNISHGERPTFLGKHYGSPVPTSFARTEQQAFSLVNLRNNLIHEARWCGEAIGYAVSNDAHSIINELKHFNQQLILGFLNIDCEYRKIAFTHHLCALDLNKTPRC